MGSSQLIPTPAPGPGPAHLNPHPRSLHSHKLPGNRPKQHLPLLLLDILARAIRPLLAVLSRRVHRIVHDVKLLRALVKLAGEVIAPALLILASPAPTSTPSAPARGELALDCRRGRYHALAGRAVGPADQEVEISGRDVLRAGDPLDVRDGGARRHGQTRVD